MIQRLAVTVLPSCSTIIAACLASSIAAEAAIPCTEGSFSIPPYYDGGVTVKKTSRSNKVSTVIAEDFTFKPAPRAIILSITVWATAKFQPPNPTWFETTIKLGPNTEAEKNPVVARMDTYRDGNAQQLAFSNTVSWTGQLGTPMTELLQMSIVSKAIGPGASTVKDASMCINYTTSMVGDAVIH